LFIIAPVLNLKPKGGNDMDLNGVRSLSVLLANTNPRKTRGFLDSVYAGIKRGVTVLEGLETANLFIRLLMYYGFFNHACKVTLLCIPFPIQIDAVTHCVGVAKGYSILSLGRKLVNSSRDWESYQPIASILVPKGSYQLGQYLTELPKHARDVDQFFSRRTK